MARTRSAAMQPPVIAAPPTWRDWPWKVQEFQVHTARDILQLGNEYVAALAAARDPQAVMQAQRALAQAWKTCIDSLGERWAALAQALPVDAWAAVGWRPKGRVHPHIDASGEEAPVDLLEQARLGAELLLRPWVGAPDLDHTDEFVA